MKYTRTDVITASAAAIAAAPLIALSQQAAVASDAPKLDPNDPQAMALAYTHMSARAGADCGHCQLYTGDRSAERGACAIFPGKLVANAGRCSAWVGKAG